MPTSVLDVVLVACLGLSLGCSPDPHPTGKPQEESKPAVDPSELSEQKREVLATIQKMKTRGEHLVEGESLPLERPELLQALLAIDETDITRGHLYGLAAVINDLSRKQANRDVAAKHFAQIAHYDLKLLWALVLWRSDKSPVAIAFLRAQAATDKGKRVLGPLLGPEYKDTMRELGVKVRSRGPVYVDDIESVKRLHPDTDWVGFMEVNDEVVLAVVKVAPELHSLSFSFGNKISGVGFQALAEQKTIKYARVMDMDAADGNAWYAQLASIDSLEEISMEEVGNATDDVFVTIAKMSNLKRLHVWGSKFTDASLVHLSRCMSLEFLFLDRQNQITQEAIDSFKGARPGCRVKID